MANRLLLPVILLTEVQSLDNKLYKVRARTSFQRETRVINIVCPTETCLLEETPEQTIVSLRFSVFRADGSRELSGKGKGVFFMINNALCDPKKMSFPQVSLLRGRGLSDVPVSAILAA